MTHDNDMPVWDQPTPPTFADVKATAARMGRTILSSQRPWVEHALALAWDQHHDHGHHGHNNREDRR